MSLDPNVIQNIANNYVCLYRVDNIRNKLVEILETKGNNIFYLFKAVCEEIGRVAEVDRNYFIAEIAHEKLMKEIEHAHFINVLDRRKYAGNHNVFFLSKVWK